MIIGDLVDKQGVLIKMSSRTIPEIPDSYPRQSTITLSSDTIVLLYVINMNPRMVQITYLDNDMISRACYVPKSFEVSLAPDDELIAKFRAYQMSRFDTTLHFNSLVGSDPEVFVANSSGALMPAFDFLGSKAAPCLVQDIASEKTYCYWDGYQAEFTTRARNCLSYHVDSVQEGLAAVLRYARLKDTEAKLLAQTVVDIPNDLLLSAKEEHVEFGCMPSLNAYGMKGASMPGRLIGFRPAGGHIHFGIGKVDDEQAKRIVQALDAILGVACVSLFASFDDPRRRVLYGLAGEYRLPPHGLEYRTLSNAWLFHPLLMNLVFDLGRKALAIGSRNLLEAAWKGGTEETIEVINSCDVVKARAILERNKDILNRIFETCNYSSPQAAFNAYLGGAESFLLHPTDIHGNWCLDGGWVNHCDKKGKSFKTAWEIISSGQKVA